jgi:hypothetical protein
LSIGGGFGNLSDEMRARLAAALPSASVRFEEMRWRAWPPTPAPETCIHVPGSVRIDRIDVG